jgi:putative copper export protein
VLSEIEIAPLISRWIHLTAVIVAVGGTVFLRLVLHPSATSALAVDTHDSLKSVLIRRWARVVHIAIAFILLSGLYNAVVMFPQHTDQPLYHAIFGIKFLLALALFFFAIALTGKSAAFTAIRNKAPQWMMVNIVLAGIIVLLSNILRYIPVQPAG